MCYRCQCSVSALLVIAGLLGLVSACDDRQTLESATIERKAAARHQEDAANAAQEQIRKRVEQLQIALLKRSPNEEIVGLCATLPKESLSESLLSECLSQQRMWVRQLARSGRGSEARAALATAVRNGLPKKDAKDLDRQVSRAEQQEAAKRNHDEDRAEGLARKAYGAVLRERFLDKGMDIKVVVSGANNDHITLTWSLFSDVWVHQMEKSDGLIPEIYKVGFNRLDVKNGYDYHMYWDFAKLRKRIAGAARAAR